MPYVRRDGVVNPESRASSDSPRLYALTDAVETLAFAHWFTGDSTYSRRAGQLVRRFFLDSATTGRPNEVNIDRMRGLCRFVAENPRDFAFETVGDLAARLPAEAALPERELALPRGKPWLRAGRLAEQGFKRIVERAGARLPL